MNTNKYNFFAKLTLIILLFLNVYTSHAQSKHYELQIENTEISDDKWKEAVRVLEKRFDCQGLDLEYFTVGLNDKKISFNLTTTDQAAALEILVKAKGEFMLYGNYIQSDLTQAILQDDQLQRFLVKDMQGQTPGSTSSDKNRDLIHAKKDEKVKVEERVLSLAKELDLEAPLVAWSYDADTEGFHILYLLSKHDAMEGHYLKSVKVEKDSYATDHFSLRLKFDKEGKGLWADLTESYLERRILMLIDGEVYFAPIVKSPITSGDAMISGDFSQQETLLLKCILDHPMDLNLQVK